jgi:GT2 family glycosyltransferase
MVYILLPVHNRRAITERFVGCLAAQTQKNFHLVLIDDGSTDGTAAMVLNRLQNATVLTGDGNWWWAGSLQRGFDWLKANGAAGDDLILIINDDVSIGPDYLESAIALMRDRHQTLLLSQYLQADGTTAESGVHADLNRLTFQPARSAAEINCLSTRGLFARWADLEAIGGFHPRLLPHYLSDYEYTIRAHRMGFRCETSPELVIVPDPSTTGFHKVDERKFSVFLTKYFSKRSAINPVYWTAFVLLVHRASGLGHVARLWKDTAFTLARAYRDSRRVA